MWQRRGFYPVLGGLRNPEGRTCFAASVAQVFLRIPAMIVWLERHAELCDVGTQGGCLTCALRETRRQLGAPRGEPAICARSVLRRVDASFADERQRDACEFAHELLRGMAGVEAQAGRVGVWPRADMGVATRVDRL